MIRKGLLNTAPSAILIPPPADSFVVGHVAITKFFQEGASAIKNPVLTPLVVHPEGPTVSHEIGNVTFVGNEAGNLYYVRWEHRSSKWTIAADIMAIGEPGAAAEHVLAEQLRKAV